MPIINERTDQTTLAVTLNPIYNHNNKKNKIMFWRFLFILPLQTCKQNNTDKCHIKNTPSLKFLRYILLRDRLIKRPRFGRPFCDLLMGVLVFF